MRRFLLLRLIFWGLGLRSCGVWSNSPLILNPALKREGDGVMGGWWGDDPPSLPHEPGLLLRFSANYFGLAEKVRAKHSDRKSTVSAIGYRPNASPLQCCDLRMRCNSENGDFPRMRSIAPENSIGSRCILLGVGFKNLLCCIIRVIEGIKFVGF